MHNNIIKFFQFGLLGLLGLTVTTACQGAKLQVNIDNINNNKGVVLVQLFKGNDNYKKSNAESIKVIQAKSGAGKILFTDLATGEYVVRVVHDENNNKKIEINPFGIPTEGYGYSNEAVGNMGPPKYEDMIVSIANENAVVNTKVKMIYP